MRAQYRVDGQVALTLDRGEALAGVPGPLDLVISPTPGLKLWEALIAVGVAVLPWTPAPAPDVPVTVTGNQWIFALRDLGLSDAWEAAVARSKTSDRQRWGAVSRNVVIAQGDPLMVRIAANAGTGATGAATIDPAAVFAKAQTEPT